MKQIVILRMVIVYVIGGLGGYAVHAAMNKGVGGEAVVAGVLEEEIKEQESSQEQKVKAPSRYKLTPLLKKLLTKKGQESKRTQLLTIFLDNSEASLYAKNNKKAQFPTTGALLTALHDKAGPIITSASLLYNLVSKESPFTENNPEMAAEFQKLFNGGDDWIIKEVYVHLLIMIPKSYLKATNMTEKTVGLNIDTMKSVDMDTIGNRYIGYSFNDWDSITRSKAQPTGRIFVSMLINNRIFDVHNQDSEWVIYLFGHGKYGETIATIPLDVFPNMLNFFDKKIKVDLSAYNSCYGAGLNAAQVYGELTRYGASVAREYSFPIITMAITDALTGGAACFYDEAKKEIVFRWDFKRFIETLIADSKINKVKNRYERAFSFILPGPDTYILPTGVHIDAQEIKTLLKGNFPRIRPARSPNWFPLIEDKEAFVHINETMAQTRKDPLCIGGKLDRSRGVPLCDVRAGESPRLVKAVFFDTDYVPFEVVVSYDCEPLFIITMPGDAQIYIEKMINGNSRYIAELFEKGLHWQLFQRGFYKGNKRMYIKELLLTNAVYRDVVIDFAQEAVYYTDKDGDQVMMNKEKDGSITWYRAYQGDYHDLYPDPLLTDESIKEKAAKRQGLQRVEQALTTRMRP